MSFIPEWFINECLFAIIPLKYWKTGNKNIEGGKKAWPLFVFRKEYNGSLSNSIFLMASSMNYTEI